MLRVVLAIAAVLCAAHAVAQVSGTASLASDDRYRGVSLTDGAPAAHVELAYDGDSGQYAGAALSDVRFDPADPIGAQLLFDAGYAQRIAPGLSADAALVYSTFTGNPQYAYTELQAGLAWDDWSARIDVSPNYFGQDARSIYTQIEFHHGFPHGVELLAHLGGLWLASAPAVGSSGSPRQVDGRCALALVRGRMRYELAWVATSSVDPVYPVYTDHGRTAWVLSLAASF